MFSLPFQSVWVWVCFSLAYVSASATGVAMVTRRTQSRADLAASLIKKFMRLRNSRVCADFTQHALGTHWSSSSAAEKCPAFVEILNTSELFLMFLSHRNPNTKKDKKHHVLSFREKWMFRDVYVKHVRLSWFLWHNVYILYNSSVWVNNKNTLMWWKLFCSLTKPNRFWYNWVKIHSSAVHWAYRPVLC